MKRMVVVLGCVAALLLLDTGCMSVRPVMRLVPLPPTPKLREGSELLPFVFPWPPPQASASDEVWRKGLRESQGEATLHDIYGRLTSALDSCGYFEGSCCAVDSGFALVTRLEQISSDGTPMKGNDRWTTETCHHREFTIGGIFSALFAPRLGFYRIIVFIVAPHLFSESPERIGRDEAMDWLRAGLNGLPDSVAALKYTSEHKTTALIYEFEEPVDKDTFFLVVQSPLNGREHLAKSGLLSALGE